MSGRILLLGFTLLLTLENLNAQVQLFEREITRYQALINASTSGSNASSNFSVNHYRLDWEIDPAVRFIKGKVTPTFIITAGTNNIVFDLSDVLQVDSVVYHGNKITHGRPGNHQLKIDFPGTLSLGTRDSITIHYQGAPEINSNRAFNVSNHTGVPIIWTLSEPFGSRDWWPCRNGLDDKADSIDVFVTTPEQYFATSNGLQTVNVLNAGKRTTGWTHKYPIASYLVAIAATNYTVQEDTIQLNGKILPLQQYVYPEAAPAWTASIAHTRSVMRHFESRFGPYPFRNERYAHTQIGANGGMEHQTNSFMGSTNQSLIAHELGHQWFGDRVTCGSWQDIWLNEGFAVFSTYNYFETVLTENDNLQWLRSDVNYICSEPGGSVYVKDTSTFNSIFNYRTTYVKAGWVVQMLRWRLGDDLFFEGVRRYLTDPLISYKFARSEDLKRNLEAVSGQDLTEYFSDWLYGEGFPSYDLSWTPIGTKIQTSLSQTTSHPSVDFFENPVPILFKNTTRDTVIIIDHKQNAQSEIFELGFVPDTAIIDPYVKIVSFNNKTKKLVSTKQNEVRVYPNPVGSQFNVLLQNFSDPHSSITVHNAAGQLVWKQDVPLPAGSDLINISSSHWSRGIYILTVRTKGSKFTKRILK